MSFLCFSECFLRNYRLAQGGSVYKFSHRQVNCHLGLDFPTSPAGKCRWACLQSTWRRRDAQDIWGRCFAERVVAEVVSQSGPVRLDTAFCSTPPGRRTLSLGVPRLVELQLNLWHLQWEARFAWYVRKASLYLKRKQLSREGNLIDARKMIVTLFSTPPACQEFPMQQVRLVSVEAERRNHPSRRGGGSASQGGSLHANSDMTP